MTNGRSFVERWDAGCDSRPLLEEADRLAMRCAALAFLQYGSSGPDDPWQAKLDEVTKPLHAEIERLQARLGNCIEHCQFSPPACHVEPPTANAITVQIPDPPYEFRGDSGKIECPLCAGDGSIYPPDAPAPAHEPSGESTDYQHLYECEKASKAVMQCDIDSLKADIHAVTNSAETLEALKTAQQALIEVRHAQEVGADWYTRGESGLYQQVRMWVGRALEAINKARPIP